MSESRQDRPPVPRLVVRVGVTGHREASLLASNDLREAVRQTLENIKTLAGELLQQSSDFYQGREPVLRVISPLAEGADRLVAQEALAIEGYELQSPLPFPKSEYEKEFSNPESIAEFNELLTQATAVFEMDGSRATPLSTTNAYNALGELLLRQCDVLIAVWDGEEARGPGGTGHVVDSALAAGLPTIRISTKPTHPVELLNPGRASGQAPIRERLFNLLAPPSQNEAESARQFLAARSYLQTEETEGPPRAHDPISSRLRMAFQWADSLANRYATLYRKAYFTTYSLGACAVLFAFLGYSADDPRSPLYNLHLPHGLFLTLELAALLIIAVLVVVGRSGRWHERWLDCRYLAESLRTIHLLSLFGRVISTFQIPAHLAKEDPRKAWFHWYFRAMLRDSGLASIQMGDASRANLKEMLRQEVENQIAYHSRKVESSQRQLKIGRALGYTFFLLAVVSCISHFWIHEGPLLLPLNLAVIVLPAFAGAIGAILHHSEAERIERRSHSLEERLKEIRTRFDDPETRFSARELGDMADGFSKIYLDELTEWRVLLIDLPPLMPT